MTREERQLLWSQMARAEGEFKGISVSDRRKASELLGKAQADFVEVRVAPIATDPQAGEEELLDGINGLLGRLQERAERKKAEERSNRPDGRLSRSDSRT
jgi:hypothetical protein